MIQYWGPKTWKLIHCVSQNYPNNPTELDKQYYTYFFHMIPYILPCKKCQFHFLKQLRDYPIKNYLQSKKNICMWTYTLHNNVNIKNNKNSLSYKEANRLYHNKLYINDINLLLIFLRRNVQYGHLNQNTYNLFLVYLHKIFPVFPSSGG